MKRALLVSPYFTPSNLAGVQRVRLMSAHLREFGWEPIVISVDPRHYEEPNDDASLALLPSHLNVERVGALPARFCRPLGSGDMALRAQWTMRRKVAGLVSGHRADLIFATVLPGFASLVGAWAKPKFHLPFVLDYQDPWVSDWGAKQPWLSKAGFSHRLALHFEPKVVPQADALTAVSDETLAGLRQRNLIRPGTPVEIIPIGADPEDHTVAARLGKSQIEARAGSPLPADPLPAADPQGVTRPTGTRHLAYVGTLTERMLPALRALLVALKRVAASGTELQLHLLGTSAQARGEDNLGIAAIARGLGVADMVTLQPRRVPYLDALRTMQDADVLLLLGSTDSHYTASKLFPCWLAKRPILGLFHSASTVVQLSNQLGGVVLVTYGDAAGPETRASELGSALQRILTEGNSALPPRNASSFEPYSARAIAKTYASLFGQVSERAHE